MKLAYFEYFQGPLNHFILNLLDIWENV